MKRALDKYLRSKNVSEYSKADEILSLYAGGFLKKKLQEYGSSKIEFFPEKNKKNYDLQIYFNYYNLAITCDFSASYYEYCIYDPDLIVELTDESFIRKEYEDGFDIENFLKDFFIDLKKLQDLDISFYENKQAEKSQNKNYAIIVLLFLIISILFFVTLVSLNSFSKIAIDKAIFVVILILIIVLYFIYLHFNRKSK